LIWCVWGGKARISELGGVGFRGVGGNVGNVDMVPVCILCIEQVISSLIDLRFEV
jgi:hypothetical protein